MSIDLSLICNFSYPSKFSRLIIILFKGYYFNYFTCFLSYYFILLLSHKQLLWQKSKHLNVNIELRQRTVDKGHPIFPENLGDLCNIIPGPPSKKKADCRDDSDSGDSSQS